MSSTHVVRLPGCAPEPLMSYLKALGILRLVSEQTDPNALGHWDRDAFVLGSILSREDLVNFLLADYAPTPLLGPWAGGSGFFGNDNRKAVQAIEESSCDRLDPYRKAIGCAQRILETEGLLDKPAGPTKASLLRRYRREMPDSFVRWMDAAMALGEEDEWFAPILGTGGNDGRLDFTQNFMQRIVDLKLHQERPRHAAADLLRASLWAEPTAGLGKAAVGQFAPGRAGGPNATQGMEAGSTDNPWDFLLGLEGTLTLSAAAVRKFGVDQTARAAFPFTVGARPVGTTAASSQETTEARGELWLPLWKRSASAREVQLLFAEGRAELAGRSARDTVEFSRAVAGLGTDRGIHSFCRYGLFKRSGKAFLAVATERFNVPAARRESVDLLLSLDAWLTEFRTRLSTDAPHRLQAAVRRIESKIFDYCRYGDPTDLLGVLMALGAAERELAVTGGQRGGKQICRPIQTLPAAWIEATNDGSAEFEIALALASIHDQPNASATQSVLPLRANLEPVQRKGSAWVWEEAGRTVVWKGRSLVANMVAVLERRLLDGGERSLCFHNGVRIETIARFLAGETDDRRIEDLLWALAPVWSARVRVSQSTPSELPPRAFAILKPLFLPFAVCFGGGRWEYAKEDIPIKLEPRVLPLLRAGRIADACEIAARRLLVSGLKPMFGSTGSGTFRKVDAEIQEGLDPTRLAASLLLPMHAHGLDRLLPLVTRPPEETSFS